MTPEEADEAVLAELAIPLGRILRLFGQLDVLAGHTAVQWGVERVLSGVGTPAAERRVELQDELMRYPAWLVRVARRLRDNPPDSPRGRYASALLCGLTGEDLRKAAKLSREELRNCRRWLGSIF